MDKRAQIALLILLVLILAYFLIQPMSGGSEVPDEGPTTRTSIDSSPFGLEDARNDEAAEPYFDANNLGVKFAYPLFIFFTQVETDSGFDWSLPTEKTSSSLDDMVLEFPENIQPIVGLFPKLPDESDSSDTYIPIDLVRYEEFVKETVERYDGDGIDDLPGMKSKIKYWQVDSEPLIGRDYAGLVEITCQAVKEADPEAKVILGAVVSGCLCGQSEETFLSGNSQPFNEDILQTLESDCIDIFDIHYYSNYRDDYRGFKVVHDYFRELLNAKGLQDTTIWSTGMGSYSGTPTSKIFSPPGESTFRSEAFQAADILKHYVFYTSLGVEKIFLAMGMVETWGIDYDNYFAHTGLIYDGNGNNDLGAGVKKLGYYSYKFMTEKLSGSDWNTVQEIYSQDHIYAYKLMKDGQPLYVVWWDYWEDSTETKTVSLSDLGLSGNFQVTEAIPHFDAGQDVTDYNTAFTIAGASTTLTLGQSPVYLEATTETLSEYLPHVWSDEIPEGMGTTLPDAKPSENGEKLPSDTTGDKPPLDDKPTGDTPTNDKPSGDSDCGDGWCDKLTENEKTCPSDCQLPVNTK